LGHSQENRLDIYDYALHTSPPTLIQASGAGSTFFKQLAKMRNLKTCRMSRLKIVGSRHAMVYLIEMNRMPLEGPDVSDRLKQMGFTLEIDLNAWTQKEGVHHTTNWKCTTLGMCNDVCVECSERLQYEDIQEVISIRTELIQMAAQNSVARARDVAIGRVCCYRIWRSRESQDLVLPTR
jgi:hypothetical protein